MLETGGLVLISNSISISKFISTNALESELVRVIDEMAPIVPFVNNSVNSEDIPRAIKNKLNCRKKLLQKQKHRPTIEVRNKIKELNCEIKTYY